jgi:beta-phosphoglucomutase
MRAEGVDLTEADFRATFGQRNNEILSGWLGSQAGPERIREVGDEKEERYRALVRQEGIAPLPGAEQWVRALRARGWRQAIASSAPRLNVETVEEALGFTELVDAVVAAEDVREGKPDPEVFLTAAARLGAAPGRCIVVEDAVAGLKAARRAGMRSIGVGVDPVHADLAVDSLEEIRLETFVGLIET